MFLFSKFPVSIVKVTATAYNTEGEAIITHSFVNIILTPNKRPVATGRFFKSQGSGTFTLETGWDADNQVSY